MSASPAGGGYRAQAISPEAAALFARADLPGAGASLVLDVEALRELGLVSHDEDAKKLAGVDLALAVLPVAAAQLGAEGAPLARLAVLFGLLRDWGDFPKRQRFGVIVRGSLVGNNPEQLLQDTLVVMAVDGDEAANFEALRGTAALLRDAMQLNVVAQGKLFCISIPDPSTPLKVCEAAGPGYFAIGTEATLNDLAPGGAGALPTASSAVLRIKAEQPGIGKAELTLGGPAALTLHGALQSDNQLAVEKIEQTLREGLRKLDEVHEQGRAAVAPALEDAQRAMAADAAAPPALKAVAAGTTLERLLDHEGYYATVRKSATIARLGGALSAELVVPEKLIHEVASAGNLFSPMAMAGVLAAIAVPNFVKFQCRAKQGEARANLKALYTAQKAFLAEKERFGSFDEIGFRPTPPTRYSYCIDGKCLACTLGNCAPPDAANNPCANLGAPADDGFPRLCAVAGISGKSDVWTIDGKGVLANVQHGCD